MGYRNSDKIGMKRYEKVWKSMKFWKGLLRPYMKKYEMIDENYIFFMNLYEKVWNSMK